MSFHSQFQQPSQPDFQPGTESTSKRQGFSKTIAVILIVLALALIGGGMLFAFVGVIQPYQQHAQATATAQTIASQATGTARTYANATAAVLATANANITATAITLQDSYIQATRGTPALNDALNVQNGNNWDVVRKVGTEVVHSKTTPIMLQRNNQITCTHVLPRLPASPISPIKCK